MDALLIARQKRAEMKAAGIKADKHVTFSGTEKVEGFEGSEVELLQKAISRAGYTSMVTYIKDVVTKAALVDAARPVKSRDTKSVEQLLAAKEKLEARIAKKSGGV